MTLVRGFPPIENADAHTLILGTMPSQSSLRARQYYAHPQNQFWRIVGTVIGFDPALPYKERTARLMAAGIALWDVLDACVRPGSLDAAIVEDSAAPNDFPAFFAEHPRIRRVFFNGTKAEQIFRRRVLPALPAGLVLEYTRLPSTSPANASIPPDEKLQAWRALGKR